MGIVYGHDAPGVGKITGGPIPTYDLGWGRVCVRMGTTVDRCMMVEEISLNFQGLPWYNYANTYLLF